ncbi:hypothetical protein [Saccharopolyspora sp. 5N708]|uniref:hypothetical protein n=1 Tax=Saccharopolyspora sp. 5N708 TaxID=3457424 RepID=UPI003FD2B4AF
MQQRRTVPGALATSGNSDQLQYFQYRRGAVPEWCRFSHMLRGTTDSLAISWCRQRFRLDAVEECAPPDGGTPGLPEAVQSCTDCMVSFAFRGSEREVLPDAAEIPARIDTPEQMVSAMRLLEHDLGCEAEQLSVDDVDTERLGCLAAETEQLARALRRFGWLADRR